MERASYLSSLRSDAAALLDAAGGGLGAAVPSCPGWDVERLVGHVGRVWRWTAGWVASGSGAPSEDDLRVERPPAGEAVVEWSRAGLDVLVAALEAGHPPARADAPVTTWAGRQPPLFWPRRMALEAAVHRWDAQLAHGEPAPIDAALAVDGIDEVFDVLLPERHPEAMTGDGETLHLHATDAEGEWLVTLTPGHPRVERAHAKGDVAARGPASDLYLFLWNRVPADRLQVFGDDALLARWTASVRL